MPKIVTFKYMNHRGVVEDRTVEAHSVDFHFNPGFGYQPGWFLNGEVEGKGRRSFALSRIIFEEGENRPPQLSIVRF